MGFLCDHLTQRGVGMDSMQHLGVGRFDRFGQGNLGYELCRFMTDDMAPQNLAILGIVNDLHKTKWLPCPLGLTIGAKGKLANLEVITGLTGFFLCVADGCNLGVAVGTSGNGIVIDWHYRMTGKMLSGENAFL